MARKTRSGCCALALAAAATLFGCGEPTEPPQTSRIPMEPPLSIEVREVGASDLLLPAEGRGHVWRALEYRDAAGTNLLVLRREESSTEDDDGYVEQVRLSASHYVNVGEAGAGHYRERWQSAETVDCEGLDFEVDFLQDAILVEDLDGDGHAEILFGYSMFCGGGVDPHEIKLVLHAREHDYLLHGESLIQPPGGAPAFGGSHVTTPAEDDIPAPMRSALLDTWERIKAMPPRN